MKCDQNISPDLGTGTDSRSHVSTSSMPVLDTLDNRFQSETTDRNKDFLQLQSPLRTDLRSRIEEILRRSSEISMGAILLATFKILLYRYTDETHSSINVYLHESDGLVNTAPTRPAPFVLQSEVHPNQTSRDICRSLFDRIFKDNPLNTLRFSVDINALQLSDVLSLDVTSNLDFSIVFTEDSWHINLSCGSNLFKPETLERLMGHYQCLLDGMTQDLDAVISQLPILTEPEKHQLLIAWNQTDHQFFPESSINDCIHHHIEQQVERTPNAIALRYLSPDHEIQELTYQELNHRANQLAHHLRSLGIAPHSSQPTRIIGICTDRSPEMVIAFLGVLKAGAAYLPLDPAYPHDRRMYQLNDCQMPILLTQASLYSTAVPPNFQGHVICLDRDWPTISDHSSTNPIHFSTSDTLAYVMYTSGSTGNPKGVMVAHSSLVNHAFAMRDSLKVTSCDRVLQFCTMNFDGIVLELYPTLISGATLVLRSEAIASSISEFITFIDTHEITIIGLPTAFWHELVRGMSALKMSLPRSVRLVWVGGEKASKTLYLQWLKLVSPSVRWISIYGPTETTVNATFYDPVSMGFQYDQPEIPIGLPISNVNIYILDRNHNPIPIGVTGELYIGGIGVAKGYLNRIEKTAAAFVVNPFSPDSTDRLYRTGDRGRYLNDGIIEFVGRQDFQVKIRGFRIELGEIERALESHPNIQQAIVIAVETQPNQKALAAYFVLSPNCLLSTAETRSFLQTQLPNYMVPVFFIPMPSFPLTVNGKVDRKALPSPIMLEQAGDRADLVQPQDSVEEWLVKLWSTLLGVPSLSVTDNFFDLGGHSLLILQMLVQIEERWTRSLPVNILFQAPTIRQLSALLQNTSPIVYDTIVAFRTEGTASPIFCIPGMDGNLFFARELVDQCRKKNLDRPVYGLQEPLDLDSKSRLQSIHNMAAYYVRQVQAVQPQGPYHLMGYSIGGLIAYEMAQQLQLQGQEVALLSLLDPSPPPLHRRSRPYLEDVPMALRRFMTSNLIKVETLATRLIKLFNPRKVRDRKLVVAIAAEWYTRSQEKSQAWISWERALSEYWPKQYEGETKMFFSDDWRRDAEKIESWDYLTLGKPNRCYLPGSHFDFYKSIGMETIVKRLY